MPGKHFNATKEALKTAVKAAIPEGKVEGNWFNETKDMVRHLPYIYTRITPATEWDVYHRDIGDASRFGSISNFRFQLYIFHSSCCEPDVNGDCTCEEGQYAQDIGDRIITYLLGSNANISPVGYDIDELSMRESETLRGPRTSHICRVIVEGRIQIKRIDV